VTTCWLGRADADPDIAPIRIRAANGPSTDRHGLKPPSFARCTSAEVIEMKTRASRIGILLVLGLIAITGLAVAQQSVAPLGILPQPTPQPLTVSIWTDKSAYTVGENLTIFFTVNQPSFIYIYDIQPDGIVRLIFPNAYSQGNFVPAGSHSLPDGLYKFTVAPPVGVESLQIFASPVDLGLAPAYFGEPFPMTAGAPDAATSQIQAQILGIVPEPLWATAWTSFTISQQTYGYPPSGTTYPPTYSYPPYYPPFIGYPGGTWYYSGGQWVFGIPTSGIYWYFGTDGQWHLRIVIRFGPGSGDPGPGGTG
jgi:hypothetical protein